MAFYILQEDKPQGPYTIGQLRSMWSAGTLTGNTLYCHEGDESWKPLSVLAEHLEPEVPPQTTPAAIFYQAPNKWGVSTGVGLLIISTTIFICWVVLNSAKQDVRSQKLLTAKITLIESEMLEIKNLDGFAWGQVEIFIDGKPPFGYRSGISSLAPGKAVRVSLDTFANQKGERFKPQRYPINEIWIGGNGFDFKCFETEVPGLIERNEPPRRSQ
jgi:hypothetical protein